MFAVAASAFKRFISTEAKQFIDNLVKKEPIVVFMKGTPDAPQCGFSRAVIQILSINNAGNFAAVNVLDSEEIRSGIKEYTSWPTIPQVFIDGEFVGGCDIMMEMNSTGTLKEMLKKALDKKKDTKDSDQDSKAS